MEIIGTANIALIIFVSLIGFVTWMVIRSIKSTKNGNKG